MICPVCNTTFEDGLASCPKCKCPVMYISKQATAEEKAKYNEVIEAYRKKYNDVSIIVSVYTNKVVNGNTVETEKEDFINIAKFKGMKMGETVWYPEKFARLSGTSNLGVGMKKDSGEYRRCVVTIDDPQVDENSFWQLGAKRISETGFSIVLGTPEKYKQSREITII